MARGGIGVKGLVLALAGLGLAASLPLAAAAPYPPRADSGVSWTNGQVLCDFGAMSPSVVVSPLASHGAGMTLGGMTVDEMAPSGSVVASAGLASAVWNVSNRSTDDAYNLAYSARVPVVAAGAAGPAVGSVDLGVNFILPAYEGSRSGPTNVVTVAFSMANWSWQAAGDHLVLGFAASASSPTDEHLTPTTATGWLLASNSNSSGSALERLGLNGTGSMSNATDSGVPVSAAGSVSFASPELAAVAVAFSEEAGAFRTMSYDVQIEVSLPTTVAGIPLADLLAVGMAGVLVSVGIAAATRRIRRAPSSLIYAEE